MPRELSETDIFVLLAKRRRRLTVRVLHESATPQTTITLAERIGEREHEDPSAEEVCAIYLTLYHNHLPRLEEANVVSYDRGEGRVRPGQNFDALVRVLEEVNEGDMPWSDE